MVVREDGSKWACTSCLKGHRVSGCNHTDRELHLVPKKGRPVTQCQHCRQERKKRSAHVSCDCAAPDKPHHSKEKCIHLREAEERAKHAGFYDELNIDVKDNVTLASVAEEQGCCCSHGGRCSCALLRKNSSDCDGLPHGPAVSKPKLEASKSDGSLTVFANGHHKPVHRKNHAAHECGMPYKLPMPRSRTEQNVSMAARRSVDSLALDTRMTDTNTQAFQMPSSRSGSNSLVQMQAHLFSNAGGLTSDAFNMVDYSDLERIRTHESAISAAGEAQFPPYDPMSALLDSPFNDWPDVQGLDTNGMTTPFGAWPSNADPALVQPALTAASSGTQSEIDEIPSVEDVYTHGMPSIQELNFESGNLLAGNTPQTNRRSLPPGFFGNIDYSTPNAEEDWQAQFGAPAMMNDKTAAQPFVFNDPWQSTATQQMSRPGLSVPHASPGRPMARSIGPGSAPGVDLIKQLFPGIDVDVNTSAAMQARVASTFPVSDAEETYLAQSWADGSMSVPMDSYGMTQEFGGQGFNTRWT